MNQAQWEEVESKLWTDGVIAGARNAFATTTTSGLGISVNTGDAILDGFRCYADAATALTAATADPSLPRIDLLVFRIDESAHTSTIALITGTPASSPVAPNATKTVGGTYELALYQVRVNAGSSTITSLTDVRVYCAPTNTAQLTGATFTGGVTAPWLTATGASGITASAANAGLEMGAKASANTPFVDFNSSGFTNDYDARILASGGTSGSSGQGTLNIQAATVEVNGSPVALTGSHNTITPLKISAGTVLPGTLDSREIFILLA